MATAAQHIAVTTPTANSVGDNQPASGRGARGSTILPAWANTAQGRALITAIKAEQPARTVEVGSYWPTRYLGRNAAQLRGMFDRTFDMMLQDADNQRDALVAWRKANNADALIARVLGEAL